MRNQTKKMLLNEAGKNLRRSAAAVEGEDWTVAHQSISTALALIMDVQDGDDEWLDSVIYCARTGEETWDSERSAALQAAIERS